MPEHATWLTLLLTHIKETLSHNTHIIGKSFVGGIEPTWQSWEPLFASLSPALVDSLADHGVVLVGIDTPSIDPWDDKVMESHQAVARRDLAILEGIVLDHVEPGLYTLIALPLRLEGADASPVRAALLA